MGTAYRLIYTDEINKLFIVERKNFRNSEALRLAFQEYYLIECMAETMGFKILVQDDFGELRELKSKGR